MGHEAVLLKLHQRPSWTSGSSSGAGWRPSLLRSLPWRHSPQLGLLCALLLLISGLSAMVSIDLLVILLHTQDRRVCTHANPGVKVHLTSQLHE